MHDRPWNLPPIRTVGELRRVMDGLPDDTPVLASWEGIYRLLAPEGVTEVSQYGRALVFDVEYHCPDPKPSNS